MICTPVLLHQLRQSVALEPQMEILDVGLAIFLFILNHYRLLFGLQKPALENFTFVPR